ncbi:MAG TPA: nuclear transport factor 2 family protein [Flavobacteriaceae bacterium]|nr:nuclear transport factor 2 family protein [Flavobacteriaceae bacterium]
MKKKLNRLPNRNTGLSLFWILLPLLFWACQDKNDPRPEAQKQHHLQQVHQTLDRWHEAAAKADFENYVNQMTANAVFVGTDATENWNRPDFEAFSKPYFTQGKAWSFTAVQRNVYFSNDYKTAWFDELLDTQMKLCRGSGVLQYQNQSWKIAHYVLSIAVPNNRVEELVNLKKHTDSLLLLKLKEKPLITTVNK